MTQRAVSSEQVTRASGSSFAASFWFLPKEKRQALTAVYAYCRLTDDIVDLARTPEQARAEVSIWRSNLREAFAGAARHPVLDEVAEAARRYRIPRSYFEELIEGVEMDLDTKSYATFADLRDYCYKVASVVGLMCVEIFGYRSVRSKDYAIHLGLAFQITNILRDLKSDAGRGRIYLPGEDISRFGFSSEEFLKTANGGSADPEVLKRFAELVLFECVRAEREYLRARENLMPEDRRSLVAAEVMRAVYYSILDKIRRTPLLPLRRKVKLSRLETLWRLLQGWWGVRWGG